MLYCTDTASVVSEPVVSVMYNQAAAPLKPLFSRLSADLSVHYIPQDHCLSSQAQALHCLFCL